MKDPAALLFIDNWLTSTAEMDSDVRGWYLNLILHQFDKKDLPDNIEKLAVLAGVKFSEYERFKQVFEQVFKQKFILNDNGRLENPVAKEILRKRENFKEKRSASGKLSYFLKYITNNFKPEKALFQFIKENADLQSVDLKDEQVLKQVFEHLSELYINGDGDGDINNINKGVQKKIDFIDQVLGEFVKADPSYVIVNKGKERESAGKIVALYKKKYPNANSEETLDGLGGYFRLCVNISDDWLRNNMSPSIIISKFNEINKILANGNQRKKGTGVTDQELATILAGKFSEDK
jgi:hypothetical protein